MGNDDSSMVRRDFKKKPITLDEQLYCIWYVVENDLIGGWSISNVDKPESEHDVYNNEFTFSEFMTQEVAQHIVNLHNEWYREFVDASYKDNFLTTWNREMYEYYEQELEHTRWQVDSFDDLD